MAVGLCLHRGTLTVPIFVVRVAAHIITDSTPPSLPTSGRFRIFNLESERLGKARETPCHHELPFATIDVCCFGGHFSVPSFSAMKHLPTGTGGHEPFDLFGAPAAGSVTTSTSSVSVVAAKQSGNAPLQSKRTHDGTAHLLPPGYSWLGLARSS